MRRSCHLRRSARGTRVRVGLLVVLGWCAGSVGATAQDAVRDTQDAVPDTQGFWATVEQKERSIYFAALENGDAENWFGALVSSVPTEVTLSLSHLDPFARLRSGISVERAKGMWYWSMSRCPCAEISSVASTRSVRTPMRAWTTSGCRKVT